MSKRLLKKVHRKDFWVLVFLTFFSLAGFTQAASTKKDKIPKAYKQQFETDVERYLAFTNPYAEKAGNALTLWEAANQGNWKNFNKDSVRALADSLRKLEWVKRLEFIRQNPNSYASLYYFNQRILISPRFQPDSLFKIFSLFSKDLQGTSLGRDVVASIKRKQLMLLTQEMPAFSFKTISGQTVNLSSFRGQRSVMLCFWASWCGPCVRNLPFLKEIEATYKDKGLQLISVSIDDDPAKWLAAIKKYNMPWLQTCDLPTYTYNKSLRTLYEIHYVPQYFLIDKEGKLIYQSFLDKDEDDHKILKEVLRKAFERSL